METIQLDPRERAGVLAARTTVLLMTVASLTGFGLVMVYSASSVRAARGGGWEMSYAWNQLSWLLVALPAMTAAALIPYRVWSRLWWCIIPCCWVLLRLVTGPMGTSVNGARRWLRFGGFNVQPSELAKIGMVAAIAALLARLGGKRPSLFLHVIPLYLVVAVTVGLIAVEPDFGTAALVACALTVLMVAGGVRIWQLALLAGPILPVAAWYSYGRFGHIGERVHSWLAGNAFHTNASMRALGSGGLWGVGLGQGPAKLDYLPEAHTDFIFALIGQETGFVGCAALMLLFVVLVWQGLSIAKYAPDRFGSLLAFGVVTILGGQAVFNMGVVTGLLPPKGISLPFVSFGGSGLVVYYAMIGLLISVARGGRMPAGEKVGIQSKYKPRPAFVCSGGKGKGAAA